MVTVLTVSAKSSVSEAVITIVDVPSFIASISPVESLKLIESPNTSKLSVPSPLVREAFRFPF